MEAVTALFDSEEDKLAVSLFANWIEQMAVHGRIEASAYATLERVYRTSSEVKSMLQNRLHSMLQTAVQREKEQLRQEGIQIGEARGEARGEAKGKTERNREIAQAMVTAGYPLAVIAHLLGKAEDEVQALLAEEATQA